MKQTLLFAALGLAAFGAGAQEVGNVLSSTPVIQQVAVPRTYCNQPQAVMVQPQTSGAGGLMGAIAGGALGSTIGHGTGTAAAVLIGTIGGAILGNNIEGGGAPRQVYTQPACGTETTYENRTVGYDVTYEYAGRQYQVQMPYDPGPTIRLQVSPMGAGTPDMPPVQASGAVVAPPIQQAQVIVPAPAPIVYQPYAAYPAYPAYAPPVYYRPYYPPVGVSLNFGFGGHRHHRGHHHRRHR